MKPSSLIAIVFFLGGMCSFFIGWAFGLGQTQLAVARDCDRLGGFYVGAEVYRCARAPGDPPPRPSGQKGVL